MNSSLSTAKRWSGSSARTVAVRGTSRRSAISPKKSPGPSSRVVPSSSSTSALPACDGVEVVAGFAARDDDAAGRDRDRGGARREALEHRLRQLREDLDPPQQLERLLRDHGLGVDPPEGRPERNEQDGSGAPTAMSAPRDPSQLTRPGVTREPIASEPQHEALEHGEDATEHLVVGRALQQRDAVDLDEDRADAEGSDQDDRRRRGWRPPLRGRAGRTRAGSPARSLLRAGGAPRRRRRRTRRRRCRCRSRCSASPAPALPLSSSPARARRAGPRALRRRVSLRAVSPTTTRSAGLPSTVVKPAVSSGRKRGRSVRFGGSSRGTWAMKIADQTKSAPLSANAAAGPLSASRTPAMAGPANIPTLLIVLPDDVRGRQLLRRIHERRHQRCLGRGIRAGDDRRGDGEHVDDVCAPPATRDRRHGGEDPGADDVGGQHQLPPRPAVGEETEPRRSERGEHEAREEQQPDRARPAGVEGVNGQGDAVCPRTERRADVRELDVAYPRVRENLR